MLGCLQDITVPLLPVEFFTVVMAAVIKWGKSLNKLGILRVLGRYDGRVGRVCTERKQISKTLSDRTNNTVSHSFGLPSSFCFSLSVMTDQEPPGRGITFHRANLAEEVLLHRGASWPEHWRPHPKHWSQDDLSKNDLEKLIHVVNDRVLNIVWVSNAFLCNRNRKHIL